MRSAISKSWRTEGVWLAKAGFGAFATPFEYAPMVAWAKKHGMITTVHTGGSSIPGSTGIWADHLIAMQPHVSFHVNGGPIAMPDRDFPRLVNETEIALQLCTAGNLRTALWTAELLRDAGQFERLLIATDTPTGSGIMPLGMLYTISHLASLTKIPVEWAIAAATGNNADVYRLNSGYSAARARRRRGDHRRLRRRLAGQCARCAKERRYRRGAGRRHRRDPALRRAQPQHTRLDPERAGGGLQAAARFFRQRALSAVFERRLQLTHRSDVKLEIRCELVGAERFAWCDGRDRVGGPFDRSKN